MKKRISLLKLALIAVTALSITACDWWGKKTEIDYPEKTGDTDSIIINEVFIDEDGDKAVNVTFNTVNPLVQDARTIIPDNPDLYFTVVASTAAWAGASATPQVATPGVNIVCAGADISGDADCSAATATTSGEVVIQPYYPTVTKKMTGITLTLKVGKAYYFTVYGTNASPSYISTSSFGSDDHTTDTLYNTANGTQLLSSTAADYRYFRENLVYKIADSAVVKGTNQFFIEDNNGTVKFYAGNSNAGTLKTQIKIDASSTGVAGNGRALIPVDLEATTALNSIGLQVAKIRFKWNSKVGAAVGQCDVTVTGGGAMKIAMIPLLAVGEYDTDLILLDSNGNDIFTIHDTLTVWKQQFSLLKGNSSYYQSLSGTYWSDSYAGTNLPQAGVESLTAGSNNNPNTITAGYTSDGYKALSATATVTGYKITAQNIRDYFRTVFYVSGSGGVLPAEATPANRDGSLFHPYATVQDALDAITTTGTYNRANGYGDGTTDWNIVVDGTPAAGDISFTNTVNTTFNLTIRKYASARVFLSDNVTFINNALNNVTTPFNVWLKSVDWYGTSKTFTAGTNIFLNGTALASTTAATPVIKDGSVVLNKNKTGSADGILYAEPLTGLGASSVMHISNTDGTNAVIEDAVVVRWDYHEPNVGTVISTDYLSIDPAPTAGRFDLDIDYVAGDSVNTPTEISAWKSNPVANPLKVERVIKVDDEVGSANYGCAIVQIKNNDVAIGFEQGVLRAELLSWSPSPATFTKAAVNGGSATVTAIIKVTSEDGVNFPANATTVLNALKKNGAGTGTLTVIIEKEHQSAAVEGTHFDVTYPTAVEAGDSTTAAQYKVVITLKPALEFAVSGDAATGPTATAFLCYIKSKLGNSDFENALTIGITN